MLSFGVCDDQQLVCSQVGERIEKYMKDSKHDYEINIFTDGEDLIKSDKDIDILFLDIGMPNIDGFHAAEKMHQKNDELIIIFLTGYTEWFQRAFKVNAFRYLIKPVGSQEFNETLSDALDRIYSCRRIIVDDKNRSVLVSEGKIMYVESIGDRTVVYMKNGGNLVSGKTLKHWASFLDPDRFIQTHKSFIISFEHVRSLDKTSVFMTNGAEIPISTRNARAVRPGLESYIRRTANGVRV